MILFYEGRVYRSLDGVRELADLLSRQLPEARFTYDRVQVEGEFAYLEWSAQARGASVRDGVDSFSFRDGRIAAQSIRYTVESEQG